MYSGDSFNLLLNQKTMFTEYVDDQPHDRLSRELLRVQRGGVRVQQHHSPAVKGSLQQGGSSFTAWQPEWLSIFLLWPFQFAITLGAEAPLRA